MRLVPFRQNLWEIKGQQENTYYNKSPERVPNGRKGEICHTKQCLQCELVGIKGGNSMRHTATHDNGKKPKARVFRRATASPCETVSVLKAYNLRLVNMGCT